MAHDLEGLTAAMLQAARRAGADAADALAVAGSSVSVEVRGGRLEHAERADGVDLGLRVLIGRRQACVSASDTSARTIAEMAERAVAMAREAPEDPTAGLAEPAELATLREGATLQPCDPAPEPAPADLQRDAAEAEAAALAVAGISQVDGAHAGYGRSHGHMAATNGFSAGLSRSSRSVSCTAITGEGTGMERDWAGESRVWQADLPTPAEVGRLAAERTLARAGARRPPTGAFPVIFDERVASSLIGHLVGAANGGAVARGASWLRDALGTQVLPRGLSLREDPHRPRMSSSRLWDAEGLATRPRDIVADGMLMSYVLDLATARKLGMQSTANAGRGTSGPPSPGTTNLDLTQGSADRAALARMMGRGLIVTGLIGSTINPTTGDYSRGASGLWVEGGEVVHAVNGCTIAGNLREFLPRIIPANDARMHLSTRVPSLLVEGLMLAGE